MSSQKINEFTKFCYSYWWSYHDISETDFLNTTEISSSMHTKRCELSKNSRCKCSCSGYLHGSAYVQNISDFENDE
jgi:hypothetical protein